MRTIEHKMIMAVKKRRNMKCDNTKVQVEANGIVRVYLHGNCIAEYNPNLGLYSFNTCGWNTRTTFSRLNSLAFGLNIPFRIGTHKYVPIYTLQDKTAEWCGKIDIIV